MRAIPAECYVAKSKSEKKAWEKELPKSSKTKIFLKIRRDLIHEESRRWGACQAKGS